MLLVIYGLSGVAGLLYEVAWARLLTLHMGHTAAAASTVLAAYMGGLAAGSLLGGRRATAMTRQQALGAYAFLEIAVAVSALLLPAALSAAQPFLAIAYADGNGGALFALVRFATSLLLLAIPTTAMGATFPMAVRAFASDDASAGRQAGLLYAVNTVGAAGGAVLSGFVLLPALGLRLTTWTGCALNVAAAAGALVLARRPVAAPSSAGATRNVRPGRRQSLPAVATGIARPGIAAAALACSGFAALVNEVAWTRLLALIVGPTSYAFSAMLVAFIAGLALGSAAGTRLSARQPLARLALALGVAALAAAAVVPLVNRVPLVVARAVADPNAAFGPIVWIESGLAAALLLPMTIAFGAAFPLAIRAAASGIETAPRAAAVVYAANTAGAIAGALLAGFVLIPALGLQGTLEASSMLLAVAGAGVAFAGAPAMLLRGASIAACAAVIAAAVAGPRWDRELVAGGAYKYAPYLQGDDVATAFKAGTTLFYAEGATGTVTVRRVAGATTLAIDGKIDASNRADMLTQKLLAHLPLLLHRSPRTVCIIGLGSGVTLGAAATHPVAQIDVVEISPEVVRASAFFRRENHDAIRDPRTRLIVGDGRSHLMLSKQQYDVIISEPSNPWISGMSALFTREFFGAARARLSSGGLFCQWAHTYDMSRADLQSIVATFFDVFPGGTIWLVGAGDVLLVGGAEPVEPLLPSIASNWRRPGVAKDLAEVAVSEPFSLLSLNAPPQVVLDDRSNITLQRDDRLALEYSAPRAIYGRTRADEGARSLASDLAPDRLRSAPGGRPVVASAQEWSDRGRMLLAAEAPGPAYESFRRALEDDPTLTAAIDGLADSAAPAGQADEAVALLERIRRRDPASVSSRVRLSRLLAAGGSWDAAIQAASEAVAIDPRSAVAREQLASIYADREDAERLAPLAAQMMRDDPQRANSWYYGGTVQFLAGRFDEAARLAESATRIDSKHAGAWILAGAAYGALGNTESARSRFQSAIDADARNPVAYLNLGTLEAGSGNLERAADILAEALIVDPAYEPARAALADTLQQMGQPERAAALRRGR